MQRWRWPVAAGLLALVVVGSIGVGLPIVHVVLSRGHVVVETAIGEVPKRRVEQYFGAIRAGDRDAALALWVVSDDASEDLLHRRDAVTGDLLAGGSSLQYSIESAEYWRNDTDPRLTATAATAGVVRFHVEVSGSDPGAARQYTIDVTTGTAYDADAEVAAVRHWSLRDVYEQQERSLAVPGPQPPGAGQPTAQLPADTERDVSLWPTYTSTEWPLTLSYPPGWTVLEVVYTQQDYGPVIRVSNGGRVLELVRRAKTPPNRSAALGSASIGQMGALVYYEESKMGGQSTRRMLLVPVGAGDTIAYASIELLGTDDDAQYLQLFLTVLDSIVFG